MKIAILGNSNSILLDGWLPSFQRTASAFQTVNLSLGGSRSPAMLYQILNNPDQLALADCAIVEPTVLDCGEIAGNGDDVAGQAQALLTTLLAKSIDPTVLILPRFPRHVDAPSPGMLAWASVAASLGVAVFDGAFVIRQMALRLKLSHDKFWRDAHGHHTPAAGRLIGILLAKFLGDGQKIRLGRQEPDPVLAWHVASGSMLARHNGLPSRQSASSLMSVDCVVMHAGQALQIDLAADEKILGIAINYGEMEPRKDVIVEVSDGAAFRQINMSHPLLPEHVTHKTAVLFRATDLPCKFALVGLKNCPENLRFAQQQTQRLEISGVLIGREIKQISGWDVTGRAALSAGHESLLANFQVLLAGQPELCPIPVPIIPMKLLVLGASNEIMPKGYVYSTGATEIFNASSGGCSISAGVVNYLKHGRPKADLALLSFELNEHSIIRSGFRSKAEVNQIWDWLLCKLNEGGTYPVIIVLPRLEHGKIVRTSTCDLHREIAQRHGAAFVDIAALFVAAQATGIPQERFMKDNAHLNEDVAQIVGRHLGAYLGSLVGNFETKPAQDWELAEFDVVRASDFLPLRDVISRRTSLTSAELVCLSEGDVFDIPGHPGDTLMALSINRCSMPGAVVTHGATNKGLYYAQAKAEAYMNVVVDLTGGVPFQSAKLHCTVGSPSLKPTEATWLGGPAPVGPGRVEIEGALIRRAQGQVISLATRSPPKALTEFATSTFADRLMQDLVALGPVAQA